MDSWKSRILGVAAMTALALVASCDNGPSAVETRPRGEAAFEPASTISSAPSDAGPFAAPQFREQGDAARPATGERQMWTANRKYSARENADYHFKRDGGDFGARTLDAYVARAHAFIGDPPSGTLTITRRNGDRLFYHPASNTFAVANRAGSPRTMFKPREGMAYWEKQKARESRPRTTRARRDSDRDEG